MAYKLERKKRIIKEMEIGGEIIQVNLIADEIVKEFNRCRNDIIRSQLAIKKAMDDGVTLENLNEVTENYGQAIISLFDIVFGQENSKKIIAFYENNYTEMIEMVFPFIEDEIIPAISGAVAEERDRLKNRYLNRSTRRSAK